MVVRCTKKMLDLLGRDVTLTEPAPRAGDWYLNLLWFDRRKCLLLVHVGTLFPVFIPDVRKDDLTPLDTWLANVVRRELSAEGMPDAVLGELAAPVVLAKTASRRMLGFMNEMARFAGYAIADAGGLARSDITELNREERRMLHNRNRRYATPLELIEERLT